MHKASHLSDRNGTLSAPESFLPRLGAAKQAGYWVNAGCCLYKDHHEEGPRCLCNFLARLDEEIIYHEGNKSVHHLTISGRVMDDEEKADGSARWPDGKPLPTITIPASDFAAMGWVAEKWGMQPVVFPVAGADKDIRTAIQIASKPTKRHVYTHTGWAQVKGDKAYLTTTGAITGKGLDVDVEVQLPAELQRYALPEPKADAEAFRQSLRLVNAGPPQVMWPLLAATYRVPCGPCDFAIHVAGRSGTFKSELTSLFQSHFGAGMDARHLPASWLSTSNAVEALAYRAKNALMVVDDFVPTGTAYHVRNLQKMADNLFRGQGNQAGRSRLTDVSNLQTTYYPRGLIISTGEDIPEGFSVRGRMLILELQPGSITTEKLTQAQARRDMFPQAMADWIQWLATNEIDIAYRAKQLRDDYLGVGHPRTPAILGELIATLEYLASYNDQLQAVPAATMHDILTKGKAAILICGEQQKEHLEAADPTDALMDTIRQLLGANMTHVQHRAGGVPEDAERWGWTVSKKPGILPDYKPNGPRLGWIDQDAGEFLLDPQNLVLLKKHSGGKLAITPQTLMKRLVESGKIIRRDSNRGKNTARVTCDGHPRAVIVLSLQEVMNDGQED